MNLQNMFIRKYFLKRANCAGQLTVQQATFRKTLFLEGKN